jgi:hypothetical protein
MRIPLPPLRRIRLKLDQRLVGVLGDEDPVALVVADLVVSDDAF